MVTFYLRTRPENFSALSNKIDIKINSVLTGFGITDENIIRHMRIEKKSQTAKWIEVIKNIKTDKKIDDIIMEIKIELEGYSVKTDFSEKNNLLLISIPDRINRGQVILNKIFFSAYIPSKFKVAIIIDDLGYRENELTDFLALGIPLTYSILPYERYSSYLAGELKKNNQEYFLHQPMEPEGYPKINPGKRAILLSTPQKKIKKIVLENLKNIDGVSGINNHMGSAFTKNRKKMEKFLEVVKQRNLIFVDSWTSSKSVAYKTAVSKDIPSAKNGIFLDNEDNLEYILKQFSILKKRIKKNGKCVAIGHINRKNLPVAFSKIIPDFKKEGITFLTVSEYIKDKRMEPRITRIHTNKSQN